MGPGEQARLARRRFVARVVFHGNFRGFEVLLGWIGGWVGGRVKFIVLYPGAATGPASPFFQVGFAVRRHWQRDIYGKRFADKIQTNGDVQSVAGEYG